jgi:hypothetical protein
MIGELREYRRGGRIRRSRLDNPKLPEPEPDPLVEAMLDAYRMESANEFLKRFLCPKVGPKS